MDGIEAVTEQPFPSPFRERVLRGATELDLVRSGLEDVMRDGYDAISKAMKDDSQIPDMRIAAMAIAISRIADSYRSIGI